MFNQEDALQLVRERRFLLNSFDSWIFQEIQPFIGRRVFEVGCGLGNLSTHLLDREFVYSIDIDSDSIRKVKEKFCDFQNFKALTLSITDPKVLDLVGYRFDTVISLNVLEHIEQDHLALKNIYDLLQPDGNLILIVPAHNLLYGSMDISIGHWRRYDKYGLQERMKEIGFTVVQQKYLNTVGALGWFFAGKILKSRVPPSDQLTLMNKITPLVQGVEKKITVPFGISLLSIAKKS